MDREALLYAYLSRLDDLDGLSVATAALVVLSQDHIVRSPEIQQRNHGPFLIISTHVKGPTAKCPPFEILS